MGAQQLHEGVYPLQVPQAQTSMEEVEAQLTGPTVRRVCDGAAELLPFWGFEKWGLKGLRSQHPNSGPGSLSRPQGSPFLGHYPSTLLRAESAQTRH